MSDYSLDNTWDHARRRLALLESQLDPITHRRLQAIGLEAGWRCLEVGGGGGSVTHWLCEQVGSGGHVLATDIEPTLLEQVQHSQLEIRRHDILNDEPLPAEFDLVHARWLLHHLPDPVKAMRRMVSAVRPGGVIIFEEPDFFPYQVSKNEAYKAFISELARVAVARSGGNSFWARHMLQAVGGLELKDVAVEGDQFLVHGGVGWAEFFSLTAMQVRESMVTPDGALSEDAFDAGISLLGDPEFIELGAAGIAVSGRKPT
ncbi:MAG: class I SAM-dependent methyltransferase [Hyphomicrobiaceae bacterium]